jgi:hypothetical protein
MRLLGILIPRRNESLACYKGVTIIIARMLFLFLIIKVILGEVNKSFPDIVQCVIRVNTQESIQHEFISRGLGMPARLFCFWYMHGHTI